MSILSHLNSHRVAWQHMRGTPGYPRDSPVDHLIWATTTMKNATSWTHIDANGLASSIDGVAGIKYWVLGCCRPEFAGSGLPGDMTSMFALSTTQIDESAMEIFEPEAVIIKPGTVLWVLLGQIQ